MTDQPDLRDEAKSVASASPENRLPPPSILEIEPVYEALGHPRQRYLCYTLLKHTECSLTDLATKIAAWENDIPEHAVTEAKSEEVYVSLYHTHVPKLVDEGILTYDEASERITTAEHAEQMLTALEGISTSLDSNQESHAQSEIDE